MNDKKHPRERKGWQRLAVEGPLYYKGRHTELTREDLEAIRKNMIRDVVVNEEILVDYEHESEEKGGRVPAAGWIRHPEVEVHPDGLWARVDWTDIGREDVEKERVKYFSPVIIKNAKNKKTGEPIGAYLKSATLTNIPHIDELQIAATEHPAPEGGDHEETIVLSMHINREHKEKGMDDELRKLYGLPDDATDAQVIEAARKFKESAAADKKKLEELAAGTGLPPEKIVASMKDLRQKAEKAEKSEKAEKDGKDEILALSERVETLEKDKEADQKRINDLETINKEKDIELLLSQGKIDPSEKEEYISLREEAPKTYAMKVAKLKPKDRSKMPLSLSTENGEEQITLSEDVNPESAKMRARVMAYAEKNKCTYQEALRKVKAKNG